MTTAHIDPAHIPLNDIQKNAVVEINSKGLDTFVKTTDWSPLQKTFNDAFEKVRNDPTLQAAFQDAHAVEMAKPETRQFLEKELEALSDTVFRIKQDFENVARTVTRFDAKKLRKLKPDGSAGDELIEPLLPQWKQFQDTFEDLLKKSKKTATDGIYQAKHYREVILEMASTPSEMDDAVKEIEGFVEQIENLSKSSDDLSGSFDSLRSKISSFKTTMSLASKDAGSKIDSDIKKAEAKIEEITAEIAKFQTTATVGWISLGAGATVGAGIGIGVGLGLVAMTPVGWLLAAVAAFAVAGGIIAGAVGEVNKVKMTNELKEWQEKLKKLTETKDEVEALKVLFKNAEGQIVDIANSINTISRIWSIFHVDANLLKSAIKGATTARTKTGLIRQVKMTQNQYATLEANLETYATKMAEVEAKPTN